MGRSKKVIVALDMDSLESACQWVRRLRGAVGGFKVGTQLFSRCGPSAVRAIKEMGAIVFLDLKFHDIPNTVANGARAAVSMGADIIDVHAQGGREMIRAAKDAAAEEADRLGVHAPKVLAVTVLTSLDMEDLREMGIGHSPVDWVMRLAEVAVEGGADGVVASAREIGALRRRFGRELMIVVPGIRPTSIASDDQRRVTGPREALDMGADYIVMGRGLLKAQDPMELLMDLDRENHVQ
jgi:orotidine-5'-phosphate decarboxylase